MAVDSQATTNPTVITDFTLGQALPGHSGFQKDQLPPADDVWIEYFTNVLRGSTDGPWYDQNTIDAGLDSRTFSDSSPTGDAPPVITATQIGSSVVGTLGGGFPDGGFVPSVASPGDGNGVAPNAIPALNGRLVEKLQSVGAGSSTNGLLLDPVDGSDCQTTHDSAQTTSLSPSYDSGMHAWSGDKA